MRRLPAALMGLAAFATASAAVADEALRYVETLPTASPADVVVDTRPLAACQARSLKGARCLAPDVFLGPHHRLAAAADILWSLGASGLGGDERAVVIGDDPTARDFVAGLLYLAGVREVLIWRSPFSQAMGLPAEAFAPGLARGVVREKVFEAPMRERLWVLRGELAEHLRGTRAPALLDGRGESEFWGETVRAARGGHLPGAESLPAASARGSLARGAPFAVGGEPVVYAHDTVDGIAYFALLRAGGVAARVYPGGWAEWASNGGLPADAVTYPERGLARGPAAIAPYSVGPNIWPWLLAATFLGAALCALGFFLGQRVRREGGPV